MGGRRKWSGYVRQQTIRSNRRGGRCTEEYSETFGSALHYEKNNFDRRVPADYGRRLCCGGERDFFTIDVGTCRTKRGRVPPFGLRPLHRIAGPSAFYRLHERARAATLLRAFASQNHRR